MCTGLVIADLPERITTFQRMKTKIRKNSGTEDGTGTTVEEDNMASSGSDREANKSVEDTDDPAPERRTRTSARILKLKEKQEKSLNPEKHEQEKDLELSPPPKRKRGYGAAIKMYKAQQSDRDEDDSQDIIELGRSSSKGLSAPGELDSKRNSGVSNLEDGINGSTSSDAKAYLHNPKMPYTVHVKKVVTGIREGELEVVTTYEEHEDNGDASGVSTGYKNVTSPGKVTRTYPGPTRRVNTITKTEGRKYMILDKATIQGMMEKGLIQSVSKDGAEQQNVGLTYRALLPKPGPSIVRRMVNSNFQASSPIALISGKSIGTPLPQDFITSLTTTTSVSAKFPSSTVPTSLLSSSASTASDMASSGLSLQLPTSVMTKNSTIGTNPVVGAPVFVKSPIFGTNLVTGTEKMQFVTVPSSVLSQIQKGGSLYSMGMMNSSSVAAPLQNFKAIPNDSLTVVSAHNRIGSSSEDLGNPDKDLSDSGDDDEKRNGYGVPTGICKVLKSMKMYQYVDKSGEGNSATHVQGPTKGTQNIRWVAVPNNSNEPRQSSAPQLRHCSPPSLPIMSTDGMESSKRNSPDTSNDLGTPSRRGLRKYIKEMKLQHARLIGKHRTRYSRLQKKYSELERDFKEVEDVGTPHQIVRDAKKYLTDEHAVFMESQMFLKNVEGKGNRYSKRFLQIMLALYLKSPAGYKYLKTVFTLPSIKLLQKLQTQGFGSSTKTLNADPFEIQGDVQASEVIDSKCTGDPVDSSSEPPVSSIIKSEEPVLPEKDPLDLPNDSKDWFKSDALSGTLPSTSGQTVFISNSNKGTLKKKEDDDVDLEVEVEVEEEGEGDEEEREDDSSHQSNSDNLELGEVDESSITTFANISKKVLVVPDNETLNKQDISIQWEDAWNSL